MIAWRLSWVVAAVALAGTAAAAEPILPTKEGMTWRYVVAEQAPGTAPDGGGEMTVRIAGTHGWEGKRLLTFETLKGDTVVKTELLEVNEERVVCHARSTPNEPLAKLDPPEIFVASPLTVGATWDTDGVVAGVKLHQRFTVAAEEDVYVPAGKFHAFRLHSDEATVMTMALDRWFVPGTGFVKELTTVRGPGGMLLQRTAIELQKPPEVLPLPTPTPTPSPTASPHPITPTPTATPSAAEESPAAEATATLSPEGSRASDGKQLIGEVSDDPAGGQKTEFHSNVESIYVRWHGRGLPEGARVRVAWVAEDVGGIVDPNFIVDETETVAPAPDSSARFTLGRPEDGWAEGKYRLEFYVNDQLEETIKVRIVK
jgi:hypothetical protein